MLKRLSRLIFAAALLASLFAAPSARPAAAQDPSPTSTAEPTPGSPTATAPVEETETQPAPDGPIYLVQSGDTFYTIALKFNTSVEALVAANSNIDPSFLSIGAEVVIPGLEGVRGRLETQTIQLGESLRTLSIRNRVHESQMVQLNGITSPSQVYAGSSLIVPQAEDQQPLQAEYLISEGQSLFELAVLNGANPWAIAGANQMENTWAVLPGEALFDLVPAGEGEEAAPAVSLISPVVTDVKIDPLPILQGETAVVHVSTTEPVELTGSLTGRELHFFPYPGEDGAAGYHYAALQGVHVMADPGIYPITLQGRLADGSLFSFEQMVIMDTLGYINENIVGVDPNTIDPEVTRPEEETFQEIISKVSPEKYWEGVFVSPGYDPTWITSTFGNRRSYNGGPYSYFHTGIDYGGGTGLPITSPAAGVVVFAGPLTVRGNATIIDHGWGVYSGFWHQSEIKVNVGDQVEPGQEIGLVGATGRVTGPHLHWELLVNGVHVDPYTWLNRTFP